MSSAPFGTTSSLEFVRSVRDEIETGTVEWIATDPNAAADLLMRAGACITILAADLEQTKKATALYNDEAKKAAAALDTALNRLALAVGNPDELVRNQAAGEVFKARRAFLSAHGLPMPNASEARK